MDKTFRNIYSDLRLPVLIVKNSKGLPLIYMNVKASLLLAPTKSVDAMLGKGRDNAPLADVLRFANPEEGEIFANMMCAQGTFDMYEADIVSHDGNKVSAYLLGNRIAHEYEDYFVIYVLDRDEGHLQSNRYDERLSAIINATFLLPSVDDMIQTVISLSGQTVGVSRVYIFEDISQTLTRNTYEWCATGIEPAIQDLQDLKKEDYNYDVIVESGMYITDDVRELPQDDREILEMQGIRSLAIATIYDLEKPLGYVGFDDCINYRRWSHAEIQFLQSISGLLTSFLKRRKAESEAKHSKDILQIVSDSSDDVVYVNSLDTYRLKFVSESLARSVGKSKKELIGEVCWKVLQKDQSGPCAFCPIPKIELKDGSDRSETYIWEIENTVTGRTYIAKDSIIKWVDGESVHAETATDITERKNYEARLKRLLLTDNMTGTLNRAGGYEVLEAKFNNGETGGCLCFIDVDGLKRANDTYGHNVGDELLIETCNCIKRNLKIGDMICRWGGDEFIVWMDAAMPEVSATLAQIQEDMDHFNHLNQKPYALSFSYGIMPFDTENMASVDAMVTEADKRMYRNKMTKRGMNMRRRRDD